MSGVVGLLWCSTRWNCQRKCCQHRHPSIKGICVSARLLCLSSVAVLNYMASVLLLLLSVAWHGRTVRMHGAKFWHGALETMLCCCDVLLKACIHRHVSQDHAVCVLFECMCTSEHVCVLTSAQVRPGSRALLHTPDWPGSIWQLSVPWSAANFSTSFLLA